jgi:hypothetical protein
MHTSVGLVLAEASAAFRLYSLFSLVKFVTSCGTDEGWVPERRSGNSMSSVFMIRGAVLTSVLMLAVAACGGSKQPAHAPSSSAPQKNEAAAPAPNDLAPNKLHDRRAEEGVRAPAKALVRENAKSVKCGKLAKGGEGDEMDLLSGRIKVRAPSGSKAPPAHADAPPIEEESRLVVDGQKLSLAIVARETFQLDPDLYEPEADAPVKPANLDVEAPKFLKAAFGNSEGYGEPLEVTPVEIGSGSSKMRAYAARPPHPNATPGKDTALVLALLLVEDDGALQTVGFYVRGESVRNATGDDLVGCTRLAERVGSSLTPGPRKLERAAGRRHVADIGTDEELTLTVPQDYVAVPAHGTNGARVIKMRPLSLYAGSISVLVGGEAKVPDGVETKAPGKLFGHPVEWKGKSGAKGGFFFTDSAIDSGKGKAEVLVKATRQAKFLDEMRGIAETLAVVKRAK